MDNLNKTDSNQEVVEEKKIFRVTAVKGSLHKTVDIPVDEEAIPWLKSIVASLAGTFEVWGNGRRSLQIHMSLLHGKAQF